jgi:hypothetical protein
MDEVTQAIEYLDAEGLPVHPDYRYMCW